MGLELLWKNARTGRIVTKALTVSAMDTFDMTFSPVSNPTTLQLSEYGGDLGMSITLYEGYEMIHSIEGEYPPDTIFESGSTNISLMAGEALVSFKFGDWTWVKFSLDWAGLTNAVTDAQQLDKVDVVLEDSSGQPGFEEILYCYAGMAFGVCGVSGQS